MPAYRCCSNYFYVELTGQKVIDDDRPIQWSIDNKYYSAVVDLRVHHVTSDAVDECSGEALVLLCSLAAVSGVKPRGGADHKQRTIMSIYPVPWQAHLVVYCSSLLLQILLLAF